MCCHRRHATENAPVITKLLYFREHSGALAKKENSRMISRIHQLCAILVGVAFLMGCASTGDQRHQPFSNDWHAIQKREQAFGERQERIYGSEEDRERRKNRSTDIVRDSEGDHALGVRARDGVRADFGYDKGPKGGLKIDWDFAKPERD
jgi:hypothetical protein